jgi:hypothetical protein
MMVRTVSSVETEPWSSRSTSLPQVEQGKALIVNKMKSEPTSPSPVRVVYPIINRAEVMDISVKTIEIDRRGKEGLICNDNIRADIKVTFFVRVNKTRDDVLKVAQSIGCARASDPATLEELFTAKFSEALKTVGKQLDFEELYTKRDEFKDRSSRSSDGPERLRARRRAIDYLEQTPLEPSTRTTSSTPRASGRSPRSPSAERPDERAPQKERMEIGSQNLDRRRGDLPLEQRRAEAEAKKAKEIAVARRASRTRPAHRRRGAEEDASSPPQERGRGRSSPSRQSSARGDRAEEPRARGRGRDRARREGAAARGQIGREREVELVAHLADKEVEIEKKEIADVVRARIAVDKTVAEEEERIKDVRVIAEAKREREAEVRAEAEAPGAAWSSR